MSDKHHENHDDRHIDTQHDDGRLPLTPSLLSSPHLAIHHRARRPRTMTMHRTLRIILTHTTQHSEASMHQTRTVAYEVPRWLARFCEWHGYWKKSSRKLHTDTCPQVFYLLSPVGTILARPRQTLFPFTWTRAGRPTFCAACRRRRHGPAWRSSIRLWSSRSTPWHGPRARPARGACSGRERLW